MSSEHGYAARRWTVALSMVGMASMAAVSLLQTGVVKHLPDPPFPSFASDRVNLLEDRFPARHPGRHARPALVRGEPAAGCLGPADAHRMPLLPALSAAKAILDTLVSDWYFYRMPAREKVWCGYCIRRS